MDNSNGPGDFSSLDGPHFQYSESDSAGDFSAWEEVDPGRYMPRRVRGSCQGRVLG